VPICAFGFIENGLMESKLYNTLKEYHKTETGIFIPAKIFLGNFTKIVISINKLIAR